jgi:hypothetical protein
MFYWPEARESKQQCWLQQVPAMDSALNKYVLR